MKSLVRWWALRSFDSECLGWTSSEQLSLNCQVGLGPHKLCWAISSRSPEEIQTNPRPQTTMAEMRRWVKALRPAWIVKQPFLYKIFLLRITVSFQDTKYGCTGFNNPIKSSSLTGKKAVTHVVRVMWNNLCFLKSNTSNYKTVLDVPLRFLYTPLCQTLQRRLLDQ